ncbi:protein hunchback [Anopheles maculipalpis]|uniref:protein hunchback n=1 Tax=Anopheles maculipalpis TaxID=1496333 RepID=UPI002158AAB2|nr:protein hunchback [Anopheles maculipalpis]
MQNFDSVMSMTATQQQPAEQAHQQQQQTVTPNGGWFDLTIKSEPLDYHPSHHLPLQHHQLHHHHHQHHQHLHQQQAQQDTTLLSSDAHSNPTSPQSVDSMDSLSGKSGFFEGKGTASLMGGGYNPLGFNPLTPPGYSGLLIPPPPTQHQLPAQQQQQQQQRLATPNRMYGNGTGKVDLASLTPTHTPPMDVTPPKSPKEPLETPTKEEEPGSDCEDGSYDGSEDEEGIRKPKVNSHGQVKKFRCKQCDFIAVTKLSFWEHTRSHIKPEKMLTCPKCPFVTEYKHHLEYHLRNHQRSKPFQCPKCSYSCVNKSMLNSHMKSHSNVFQYRCADCNYATKYCHSLKLHLRKYAHKPDVVLNLDGTPNPLPIIDVYGTRRGPKAKPQKNAEKLLLKQEQLQQQHAQQQQSIKQQESSNSTGNAADQSAPLTPLSQQGMATAPTTPFTPPGSGQTNGLMRNLFPHQLFPNPLAHMFKNAAANGNLPLFPYLNLNFQMFADQQAGLNQLSPRSFQQNLMNQLTGEKLNGSASSGSDHDNDLSVKTTSSGGSLGEELIKQITAAAADSSASAAGRNTLALDDSETETASSALLQPSAFDEFQPSVSSNPRTPSTTGKGERSRRKGRAFKLERLSEPATSSAASTDMDTQFDEEPATVTPAAVVSRDSPATPKERSLECKYCDIAFRDDVLYTIHMGYHGYDDVFKCNMCGEKSEDRIGFFLHIARKAH